MINQSIKPVRMFGLDETKLVISCMSNLSKTVFNVGDSLKVR